MCFLLALQNSVSPANCLRLQLGPGAFMFMFGGCAILQVDLVPVRHHGHCMFLLLHGHLQFLLCKDLPLRTLTPVFFEQPVLQFLEGPASRDQPRCLRLRGCCAPTLPSPIL